MTLYGLYLYFSRRAIQGQFQKIHGPIKLCLRLYNFSLLLIVLSNVYGLAMTFRYLGDVKVAFVQFIIRSLAVAMLSIVIVLTYKILFNFKRVELQMSDRFSSVGEILAVLRRQICIENTVLIFYGFQTLFHTFLVARFY